MDNQYNYCIYRNKNNKNKCNNVNYENTSCCFEHYKTKNKGILNIINEIYENDNIEKLNYNNLNKLFIYIKNNKLNTNFFNKIVSYLYTYKELYDFTKKHNIFVKKKSKLDIINEIYLILFNTFNCFNNTNKLIKIQNFIRIKIKENSNTTDPFTLEDIDDINENNRFYFIDNKKKYCFNAIEFYYHLNNNNRNPYTNNIISEDIINSLNKFIKNNNLDITKNIKWNSSINAYTDVIYYMDKMGFYSDVLWLDKLEYIDIINVIYSFFDLSTNITNDFYQDFLVNSNSDNYWSLFSKETIEMFKEGDSNFILCCYLIKALAKISNDFKENIPLWLDNIVEPETFTYNINNNVSLLLLNEYLNLGLMNNSNFNLYDSNYEYSIDIVDSSNIIYNNTSNNLATFYYIINNID